MTHMASPSRVPTMFGAQRFTAPMSVAQRFSAAVVVFALLLASPAAAQLTTFGSPAEGFGGAESLIHFNAVGAPPALFVSEIDGVTFNYGGNPVVRGGTANGQPFGPDGAPPFGNSLVDNRSPFTGQPIDIGFPSPMTHVGLIVSYNLGPAGATITLYNGADNLGSIQTAPQALGVWTWVGIKSVTPFTRVRLTGPGNGYIRFDNLRYASLGCQDGDEDGVCDNVDNCADIANPGQEDTDGDDVGNHCDPVAGKMAGTGKVIQGDKKITLYLNARSNSDGTESAYLLLQICAFDGLKCKGAPKKFTADSHNGVVFLDDPDVLASSDPLLAHIGDTLLYDGGGSYQDAAGYSYAVKAVDHGGDPAPAADTFAVRIWAPDGSLFLDLSGIVIDGNLEAASGR